MQSTQALLLEIIRNSQTIPLHQVQSILQNLPPDLSLEDSIKYLNEEIGTAKKKFFSRNDLSAQLG